jgi:hypothetical protein
MLHPDQAFESLKRVNEEFKVFLQGKGSASEADTRANLIDKILVQVLDWPEAAIAREEHVDRGYIDYSLRIQSRRYVAVEAKKGGVAFTFPTSEHRSLKLSGTLLTDKQISAAINQVRGYCDDAGIRYAVATNGYAWIVFRAIREDMPWREGSARIFPSADYIEGHFTEFWNLLSFGAIQNGSLDEELGASVRYPRQLHRVINKLFNADVPLQRNRLHAQLHRIIETTFEDIADQDPVEILQSCYVHARSLKIVARDLDAVIVDAIPRFLKEEGTEEIVQTATTAGRFGNAIEGALSRHSGQLYLLLGGIGSGKTTFIKRYQRAVGTPVLEGRSLWFHLDFLEAPVDPRDLEVFAWRGVLDQLRTKYHALNIETRRNIKRAFADNIEALSQTTLRPHLTYAGGLDTAISPYLEKWQADSADYVPRLLRVAWSDRNLQTILFIDNVDQLAPAYQAQVFLLAQRVTRSIGAITILALREESYYTASLQKTLTAYTNRKFHIASPRFRRMIDSRIRFALSVLEKRESEGELAGYVLGHGIPIDKAAIADFLKIIETSIFEQNLNIARLIEALCFGNMRLALDMFTTFMTSGVTDVDKMLNIYRRSGAYYVAFHEFVKSIMLGDRRFYKDQASPIMNVFDCGAERNASHFTSLRVVRALLLRRGESTREGQGFMDIGQLASMSEDVFGNREDLFRALNRLLSRQLIESNTKSTDTIAGATHVRATHAGWYYSRFLVRAFSYIDLVLQDTPLDDQSLERSLRADVDQVDNLSDREDQKLERMRVRFARVRKFLDYLDREERREEGEFDLARRGGIWQGPFVPNIRDQVEREISWIERRVGENRERFAEDIRFESEADETAVIEIQAVADEAVYDEAEYGQDADDPTPSALPRPIEGGTD